jgi:hypothetical protein
MTRHVGRSVRSVIVLAILTVACAGLAAQTHFATGQDVQPVFEGWERNADGTFNMVFGYLNRNYEEEIDVPVGPNNAVAEMEGTAVSKRDPGPDRGQPTHFYARRQQFMFKVKVPKDWGTKDLVWSVTLRGKTEKAYASLMPVWEIDRHVYQQNRAGPGELGEPDDPPTIALIGAAQRTATVGQPITIEANVQDDGRPTARPTRSGTGNTGRAAAPPATVAPRPQNPVTQSIVKLDPGVRLGVTWVVHRRSVPAGVKFAPMKSAVADGKASTAVTFTQPGTYVIRGYADDGVLLDMTDISVTVK